MDPLFSLAAIPFDQIEQGLAMRASSRYDVPKASRDIPAILGGTNELQKGDSIDHGGSSHQGDLSEGLQTGN